MRPTPTHAHPCSSSGCATLPRLQLTPEDGLAHRKPVDCLLTPGRGTWSWGLPDPALPFTELEGGQLLSIPISLPEGVCLPSSLHIPLVHLLLQTHSSWLVAFSCQAGEEGLLYGHPGQDQEDSTETHTHKPWIWPQAPVAESGRGGAPGEFVFGRWPASCCPGPLSPSPLLGPRCLGGALDICSQGREEIFGASSVSIFRTFIAPGSATQAGLEKVDHPAE